MVHAGYFSHSFDTTALAGGLREVSVLKGDLLDALNNEQEVSAVLVRRALEEVRRAHHRILVPELIEVVQPSVFFLRTL